MTACGLSLLLGLVSPLYAQDFDVVSGPIYGHYTDTTCQFWIAIAPKASPLPFAEWLSTLNADLYSYFRTEYQQPIIDIEQSNFVLEHYVLVKGTIAFQKPPRTDDNLTFLVGSCAFPYPFAFWGDAGRSEIFTTMTEHDKDFMIWMGDNVYYLNGEWRSKRRMHKKTLAMRIGPRLHTFLKSCPQYAIWDDHDYGPNNGKSNARYKYQSLDVFKQYWPNPYAGQDTVPGIFCHFRQGDAEFFLLDVRFHANDTTMLGREQLAWLKKGLQQSTANFKFIVSGTQLLADNPTGEDWNDFGNESTDFWDFLTKERISGVVLLSGDRHYGELMKHERTGSYPIYELTSSPLTSFVNPAYTKNNPLRQAATLAVESNFGKVELLGTGEGRLCRLSLFNRTGDLLWHKDVPLSALQP